MEKKNIKINPELCTQCLRCQLACSLQHQGVFNPFLAGVDIHIGEISFNDRCKPKCTLCTLHCAYHAIQSVHAKPAPQIG
jgi:ferredoxin